MNKLRILLFTIFFVILLCLGVSASGEIKLFINGKRVESDVAPIAVDGRTMVPARSMFEKLGAEVTWIGSRQQIIVRSSKTKIVLNLGNNLAYVNDKEVEMDVEPMVVDSRTLIPVRFVSEKLGYDVLWKGEDNAVHINTSKKTSQPDKATLNKITTSVKGNTTVVTVKVSNMIRPQISYASEPMRFIADFSETSLELSGSKKEVGSKSVKEVRYALHPDYTRVVIESAGEVTYKVSYTADTMTVTVNSKSIEEDEEVIVPDKPKEDAEEKPKEELPPVKKEDAVIVIDAGHGGKDCGAIGYDEDGEPLVYESEVNLKVALAVQKYLRAEGVTVVMTRSKDVALGSTEMDDLLERSSIANDAEATFFVSIHSNSFTEAEANGTEILYAESEDKTYRGVTSKELAQNILKPLIKANGLNNRGVKDSPKIVVLRTTEMPSVLIELAFVSNPNDREVLMDDSLLDDMGYAIANGIINSLE